MTKAQERVIKAARAVVANWRKRPHTAKSGQEILKVQAELEKAVDAEQREARSSLSREN